MLKATKIIFLLMMLSPVVSGQKLINSPYSRFGLGTLEEQGTFRLRSLGGSAVAIRDPLTINYLNPASLSALDTNSFVLDFGFDYQMNKLSDGNSSYNSDDMNLHHIFMAFPITKRIGFAMGIAPYSAGYYNLSSKTLVGDPDYDPVMGETDRKYKGVGGYNQAIMSLGINPVGGLSLGINMKFLYGEITRESVYYFLDDNNYYNDLKSESMLLKGFNFDYGAQYEFDFDNNFFAVAGFSFTNKRAYTCEYENLTTKFTVYAGSPYSADTLYHQYLPDAKITLPTTIAFGFSAGQKDKFTLSASYQASYWTNATFLGYEDSFRNTSTISFGAEFIPSKYANYNYFNRVEYRLGGHLGENYFVLNNEQLKEFGITFGVGFPLNRTRSRINMNFEYSNRVGSFGNGLHRENYFNLGLSFNFYEFWFLKRKYD